MNKSKLALRAKQTGTAVALASASSLTFAADAPDVSAVVTYIGLATAAVAAIGAAKMIPAAAMWLYSNLTSMVKRG